MHQSALLLRALFTVSTLLWPRFAGATLLSQTTEYFSLADSYQLCPNSAQDLHRTGVANYSLYRRQHRLAHSAHKRLLDHMDSTDSHRVSSYSPAGFKLQSKGIGQQFIASCMCACVILCMLCKTIVISQLSRVKTGLVTVSAQDFQV